MIFRAAAFALVLLVALGCGAPEEESGELRSVRESMGDTTVVVSSGVPGIVEVDAGDLDVLWQGGELEAPGSMVGAGDGRLLVGDRDRIHLVSTEGGRLWSAGRAGEGPGEFGIVTAVAFRSADSLAAFDARLQRLSYFSPEGEYIGSVTVPPPSPHVNPPRDGTPPALLGSDLLWSWQTNVRLGEPIGVALVRGELGTNDFEVLAVDDGMVFEPVGDLMLASPDAFYPRAITWIGPDGTVARGDGFDYCIIVTGAGGGGGAGTATGAGAAAGAGGRALVRRVCRERERTPIGGGIRSPDPELLHDEEERELFEAIFQAQDIGDRLPHFDELRLAADGSLWVRTLGEELAELHPFIRGRRPELGPSWRAWDIFDPEGVLLHTLRLPTRFDPRVIEGPDAYGFLELETGEVVIARARVPVGG